MDLVLFDTPVRMVSDWGGGVLPFSWRDDHRSRIAVVPRAGGPTRFFAIKPCQLGHTANAYERDGRIVIEGIHYAGLDVQPGLLYRWELDLAGGGVREQPLDDRLVEFPRVDERRVGRPHRHVYTVQIGFVDGKPSDSQLRRYDTTTGASVASRLGPAQMPGECVHVPSRPDAAEDEAYLMTLVYDARRDGSDLVILDARAFDDAPIARIRLPRRVPFGFHGSWIPAR